MRDLKHLASKTGYFSSRFKSKRHLKNSFRVSRITPSRNRFLSFLLPVLALLLAFYPVSFLIKSLLPKFSGITCSVPGDSRASVPRTNPSKNYPLVSQMLNSALLQGNQLVVTIHGQGKVLLTINPSLQRRAKEIMQDNEVPYGVFVALQPKTGRILAMTGYSSVDYAWEDRAYFDLYPMASLFKIVTAAAALELNKVGPETPFHYRGSSHSENPAYWDVRPGKSSLVMPLSLAMGKSINPVFGRLASDYVGTDSIMTYVQRFGFNQNLFPGIPVTPSKASVPLDDSQLKLMGAGLGREVKISPFHAAVIMAAIANQGTMMSPYFIQEIRDTEDNLLHTAQSQGMRKLVTKETANQLTHMLLTTVTRGTSRKAFHDRSGRPLLPTVTVAAKTGSINGNDPSGHYSWFAAFAPVEDPEIALVALIINGDKWRIKASNLGAQALEYYFMENGRQREMGNW